MHKTIYSRYSTIINKLYYEIILFDMYDDHDNDDPMNKAYSIEDALYPVNLELVLLIDDQINHLDYLSV